MTIVQPLADRFWRHVEKNGPVPVAAPELGSCWLWTASFSRGGYGQIHRSHGTRRVHRISYELLVGPIPIGLDIDHLCRVRHCVNPSHLEAVSRQENILRGDARWNGQSNVAKLFCPQGHPYDTANTYHYAGRRACRHCKRLRSQQYRHQRRFTFTSAPTTVIESPTPVVPVISSTY